MQAEFIFRLAREAKQRVRPLARVAFYGALGVTALGIAMRSLRPVASPLEQRLVGEWFADLGGVDTQLKFKPGGRVSVRQQIRLGTPEGPSRVVQSTTSGSWSIDGNVIHIETRAPGSVGELWRDLGVLMRQGRWPAKATLSREWRVVGLTAQRFRFMDVAHAGIAQALRVPKGETAFRGSGEWRESDAELAAAR